MKKYLIFGNEGQLGKEFSNLLANAEIEHYGYDLPAVDLFNYAQIDSVIKRHEPDIIINCAAFNNVDLAEFEYEAAYRTNVLGVDNLVRLCEKNDIKLVHFSTDYVFNGIKRFPGLYDEDDIPDPVNNYGRTKLEGEKLIQENLENFLIFRLSWLYGKGEQNFIHKLLTWAKDTKILKIANDELSVPTSTRLVAEISLKAINNNLTGLFHLTNTGYASRFDWAKEVFEIMEIKQIIYPAKVLDFALPAKRPNFSAMSNKKIAEKLQIEIPFWKDELARFLKAQFIDDNLPQEHKYKRLKNEIGFHEL